MSLANSLVVVRQNSNHRGPGSSVIQPVVLFQKHSSPVSPYHGFYARRILITNSQRQASPKGSNCLFVQAHKGIRHWSTLLTFTSQKCQMLQSFFRACVLEHLHDTDLLIQWFLVIFVHHLSADWHLNNAWTDCHRMKTQWLWWSSTATMMTIMTCWMDSMKFGTDTYFVLKIICNYFNSQFVYISRT